MLKKILVLSVLFRSSMLFGAASFCSSSLSDTQKALSKKVPYLYLILHTPECLSDPTVFDGSKYEKYDLLLYARDVRCGYEKDRLRFLNRALRTIQETQPEPREFFWQMQKYREVDEDGIHQTIESACRYLRPRTMQDAVSQLRIDAYKSIIYPLTDARNTFFGSPREVLSNAVLCCIRSEQVSIKMVVPTIKDKRIQDALFYAVKRGVRLDLIIGTDGLAYLRKSGLFYQTIDEVNLLKHGSLILFEKNIDNISVVMNNMEDDVQRTPLDIKRIFAFNNRPRYETSAQKFAMIKQQIRYRENFGKTFDEYECNEDQAVDILSCDNMSQSVCGTMPSFSLSENNAYQRTGLNVLSNEVALLMQALYVQRYRHICSPINSHMPGRY